MDRPSQCGKYETKTFDHILTNQFGNDMRRNEEVTSSTTIHQAFDIHCKNLRWTAKANTEVKDLP
ncbi:hypothetical protein GCM10025794_35810 [Massilia kyonggiensis]|jgi:hypothetical protein